MRRTMLVAAIFPVAALLLLAGCEEDNPRGITAVFGQVMDPIGRGLLGVGVGVEYGTVRRSSAPGVDFARTSGTAVEYRTEPPYPNPARDPYPGARPVILPVDTGDTLTVNVEIWAWRYGVPTRIRSLFAGSLPPGRHLVEWDGLDDLVFPVPNGLYQARMELAPPDRAEPFRHDWSILVNRSEFTSLARDVFSALSDPNGSYTLSDLPVGEAFVETDTSGVVRGDSVVENWISVFFHDLDYSADPVDVFLNPGETVDLTTLMRPRAVAAPARAAR